MGEVNASLFLYGCSPEEVLTLRRFHCLFCHGYEEAGGQSAGILALGMVADAQRVLHVAGMVAPLAKDIVVYTNGDAGLTEQITSAAEGRRMTIEPRKIAALERKNPDHPEIIVRFDDGNTRNEAFMVSKPNSPSV